MIFPRGIRPRRAAWRCEYCSGFSPRRPVWSCSRSTPRRSAACAAAAGIAMEAINIVNDKAVVNLDRCIGCGLCVTTCTTGALQLKKKPEDQL